jgi:hypothetical protein
MKRRPDRSVSADTAAKRAGISRRLVDGKWMSASAGATSIFSELVRAISAKAAKNDKPRKERT